MWKSCAGAKCVSTSADVISSALSSAADGKSSSILPLADYGTAAFTGVSITNSNGKTGGFTSSASPLFFQALEQGPSTSAALTSTPLPTSGGRAFTNTWLKAS